MRSINWAKQCHKGREYSSSFATLGRVLLRIRVCTLIALWWTVVPINHSNRKPSYSTWRAAFVRHQDLKTSTWSVYSTVWLVTWAKTAKPALCVRRLQLNWWPSREVTTLGAPSSSASWGAQWTTCLSTWRSRMDESRSLGCSKLFQSLSKLTSCLGGLPCFKVNHLLWVRRLYRSRLKLRL